MARIAAGGALPVKGTYEFGYSRKECCERVVKGQPKVWLEKPICPWCQARYSPRQFPRWVKYDPAGRWASNLLLKVIYILRRFGLFF